MLYELGQDRLFVQFGQPRVHVEYVRARVRLFERLLGDVAVIALVKRRLHRLFARRVDAFADDAHAVYFHPFRRRTDGGAAFIGGRRGFCGICQSAQFFDVFGRRAAASADDAHAHAEHFFIHLRKFVRAHAVVGVFVRQPRVRLHDDGLLRVFENGLYGGQKLFRSERTVHAHRVREGRGGHGKTVGGATRERPAALLEGHRADHGQIRVFVRREQGGFEFGKVGHRLDEDEVGALARLHLPCKNFVCIVEGKAAHGFQQLPDGPYVEGDEFIACRPPRDVYRGLYELFGKLPSARLFFVRAEGVRRDHVRARSGVFAVYLFDEFGALYV